MSTTVKLEIENKKGYFYIQPDSEIIAEMTFHLAENNEMKINHTEVNEAYSGKGYGKILVQESVKYARENNLIIIPLCSFAKKIIEKNSEYQDIL